MDSEIDIPKETERLLSFEVNTIETDIRIIDHIENRQCYIETPHSVNPEEISTNEFYFPVDRGISIVTSELSLPYSIAAYIRNHTGFMIDEIGNGESKNFVSGSYSIELPAPIKLYIRIESAFSIDTGPENIEISFEQPTKIQIGARSHHEQPAATITTTDDPEDMMRAISLLSSALKTITCERSYPTLRGHPPKIKMDSQLQLPSILNKPETGIIIESPMNIQSIFAMSPIVYYFGAELVTGEEHKIKTKDGFVHNIDNMMGGVESGIERVLKKCFFLDCLTRTEGYYEVHLHEREQIENEISLDFTSIYEEPIHKQVKKYLSIPFDIVEPYLPQWKQTAYIECQPGNIEFIPFLLHDLAAIRSAENTDVNRVPLNESSDEEMNDDISQFSRHKTTSTNEFFQEVPQFRERTRTNKKGINQSDKYVQIPETESFEKAWIGTGIPIGASKLITESFENRLQKSPADDNINISIVMNDAQMEEEGMIADEVYGSREQLSFTINEHRQLTTEELREVFESDIDFLHYIGHIDSEGFECADGQLDATELDNVAVDAFLLNACSSYEQAISLIKKGAIAGIATLRPVLNSGAERIGRTIARLLDLGFPLATSLHIAKSESIMGENYVIIGDGGVNLTQSKSGIPSDCTISEQDNSYSVTYNTYLTRRKNIGSMTIPLIKDNKKYFLTSGFTGHFELEINDLLRFLSQDKMPVRKDSKLYWSDELSVEELTDQF